MFNNAAMTGAILQMLSHGLMCALFFALIGMLYGRTHTRMIDEMGGLMKVMPFLSVVYVICGLASLGLPGLSGFAAEMSIFVGAFQHADTFHRVATIICCASIVVTAVYILRAVAIMLVGPITNSHFVSLGDAKWHERLSTLVLLIAIIGMGIAPLVLSDTISQSLQSVLQRIQ
jgi:NADH-quinone oxidoreductase subunit M